MKDHLKPWLRALGSAQRSLIRKIYIDHYNVCSPGAVAEVQVKGCRRYLRRRGIIMHQAELSINVRGSQVRQAG